MKKFLLFCCFNACAAWLLAQSITPVGAPFQAGSPMVFDYSGGTGATTDWIGVYFPGEVPDGDPPSLTWDYISTTAGTFSLPGTLAAGDYTAHLFCCDGYQILASANFSVVGASPAELSVSRFAIFDDIVTFYYSGGTGDPKDWIGIYTPGGVPGTDLSLMYKYVPTEEGEITFELGDTLPPGDYDAHLFCCDGYDKLASTTFTVYEQLAPSVAPVGTLSQTAPNTFAFTGGTGSVVDWVGIYHAGDQPDPGAGGVPSMAFLYVGGVNGEVTFDAMPDSLIPGNFYDAHFFCCDGYDIIASHLNWTVTLSDDQEVEAPKLSFRALPMPAQGTLRLVFDQPASGKLLVANTLGQALCHLELKNEETIEINRLPPGTYFVQFEGQVLKVVMN